MGEGECASSQLKPSLLLDTLGCPLHSTPRSGEDSVLQKVLCPCVWPFLELQAHPCLGKLKVERAGGVHLNKRRLQGDLRTPSRA